MRGYNRRRKHIGALLYLTINTCITSKHTETALEVLPLHKNSNSKKHWYSSTAGAVKEQNRTGQSKLLLFQRFHLARVFFAAASCPISSHTNRWRWWPSAVLHLNFPFEDSLSLVVGGNIVQWFSKQPLVWMKSIGVCCI